MEACIIIQKWTVNKAEYSARVLFATVYMSNDWVQPCRESIYLHTWKFVLKVFFLYYTPFVLPKSWPPWSYNMCLRSCWCAETWSWQYRALMTPISPSSAFSPLPLHCRSSPPSRGHASSPLWVRLWQEISQPSKLRLRINRKIDTLDIKKFQSSDLLWIHLS